MSGPLSLNLPAGDCPPPATVRPAAPGQVRLPLWPEFTGARPGEYRQAAIPVLGVVDRTALGNTSERRHWAPVVRALAILRAPLLWGVQAGNEWRSVGPASFTLSDADQSYLLALVADEFRAVNPAIVVVAGADATGDPAGAFGGIDHRPADLLACHLYWETPAAAVGKLVACAVRHAKRVRVTETDWEPGRVRALLAAPDCAGVDAWWHEPAPPAVLGIAFDADRIAAFARLAREFADMPTESTAPQWEQAAYEDLWRAVVPDAPYNAGFGFERAWRRNWKRWGYPVTAGERTVLHQGRRRPMRAFSRGYAGVYIAESDSVLELEVPVEGVA